MKDYLVFTVLFIFITSACNNKSAKEKLAREELQQVLSINQVVGVGKIGPENDIVQLSSSVNGVVEKIYKKENDTVSVGSIVLVLEHHVEDEKINQLYATLKTQAAQIKVDQAGLSDFEIKLNDAMKEQQRLQHLLAEGAETQQTIDDGNTNVKTLNANVQRLNAAVSVSKSKREETKAALLTANTEKDLKIIKSPIKGKVLEITALLGGSVSMQQSFGQISPLGKTIVVCEIDETNAQRIFVGQKGWIRTVGASDTLSKATVYFVFSFLKKKSLFTDQSGEKEDRRVREIKMMLDTPEKLLINTRVECVIPI